jgi:hypothetical protein
VEEGKKLDRFLPCSYTVFNLYMKLGWTLFNNSVRTPKKTLHFTVTRINWLTLFKEIIAVYSENHTEPIDAKCRVTVC